MFNIRLLFNNNKNSKIKSKTSFTYTLSNLKLRLLFQKSALRCDGRTFAFIFRRATRSLSPPRLIDTSAISKESAQFFARNL